MFPITNHINTKAMNQLRTSVSQNENFRINIIMTAAKQKDQIPQTAPFTGADGKLNPNDE